MLPSKFFIGLGNPDKKYQNTRHNIGQIIIQKLPQAPNFLITDTYMNQSGIFVQKIIHFYKINPANLYIIHDDLDLPIGEWRLQFDRGPAGHHGIESIIQHLGTQAFWRFRIGIGHPLDSTPVENYVLQPFTQNEQKVITTVVNTVVQEITKLSSTT